MKIALNQTKLNIRRNVEIDEDTRWIVLEISEAFELLLEMDGVYKSFQTNEEWERGKRTCEYLKFFYEISSAFKY